MPIIRDLAKDFLRPSVERGDTLEHICTSQMRACDEQNCLQIGGQVQLNGVPKDIESSCLAITRFAGKNYFTTFSVQELYREIKQEIDERKRPKQQSFW
jgi:hypothetical protein